MDLLEGYPRMMLARSVEGIIAVDTPLEQELRRAAGFCFRTPAPGGRDQH